jgi:predicted ATPase/class 3 adenylate cyclase
MLRIWLLGVLRLEADGVELAAPSSRRARLLLAMLALERRAHSREALAARLWPGVLDESARTSLRTALAQLRSALVAQAHRFLEVGRERVALAGPDRVWTDVGELERLLSEGDVEPALEVCGEELLTGLEDDWVYERREELRGRLCEALARGADEAEAGGDLETALRLSRRHAALDPLGEEPHRGLIRRLAAAGDRSAALSAYERLAERLRAELRTVPSAPTRELAEALRAGVAPPPNGGAGGGEDASAVAAPQAAPGALPTGVVSFLLTDIEGSSGLWEADPEAMAAALELHDQLIARAVEAHGGRLLKQKGEGDATLAAFRRASEALACAAPLQGELAGLSWPGGLELRVRIALHTGEAHERQGDYFGPALNRAARLRGLARGGTTVVSQATAEIVRDRLPHGARLVDLGLHELRGLERPERVFELRSRAGEPQEEPGIESAGAGLPLPRPLRFPAGAPFVGREAELGRLGELWEGVSGAERAAFLAGEAGIGKTRLASELARGVQEGGALVLYGRCDEGLAVPYQPFVEALRPYARAIGLDRLRAELGPLAPDLGRLLPELGALGEPARGDPESERFALFEAVSTLLEAATREQPALLVLDDFHWAAPPTLLMLRHLIRSERALGALVLCTYRETELDAAHPLSALLADLQRDASATTVRVGGLDEHEISALLEAAAGHALAEPGREFVRALQSETGGNPFFIRELLAHLVESGAIHRADERWTTDLPATELEVPEGLRQVIRHRVARLPEPARRALSVGAVAGTSFTLALLEAVLSEQAGLLDGLEQAASAGLLAETGPAEYTFAHALVRQTIYAGHGSARRARLHRRLGEALEALGDADAHVEALARHFAEAAADGQAVKAARYGLAAGRQAAARLAYEDAAARYERGLQALELATPRNDVQRCELLLALAEARWSAGEMDKAREACRLAADLADRRGEPEQLARAALGFAGPVRIEVARTVTQPLVDLLERALTALGGQESALRARLLGRLAAALAYSGADGRRAELAREGLEMARRSEDRLALAEVLATSYVAIRRPDNPDERRAIATELAPLAAEMGGGTLAALAEEWILVDLLERGDIEAAERELEALDRLAEEGQQRFPRFRAAAAKARQAHLEGRLEDYEALAHRLFALGQEGQDETAEWAFGAQMLFLRREQGRLGELIKAIESFVESYPQIPAWRCALAYAYAELDRRPDARRELDALAGNDFTDLPRDWLWLVSITVLSEVAAYLDHARRAEPLYELLLPYADRCVVVDAPFCQGSASRPLGLLATAVGNFDAAARHFEHALEFNVRIKSPLWVAHTEHDYAQTLLRRDHPGDRENALTLLGGASRRPTSSSWRRWPTGLGDSSTKRKPPLPREPSRACSSGMAAMRGM